MVADVGVLRNPPSCCSCSRAHRSPSAMPGSASSSRWTIWSAASRCSLVFFGCVRCFGVVQACDTDRLFFDPVMKPPSSSSSSANTICHLGSKIEDAKPELEADMRCWLRLGGWAAATGLLGRLRPACARTAAGCAVACAAVQRVPPGKTCGCECRRWPVTAMKDR